MAPRKEKLSSRKAAVFLAITLAFPFILFALVECGLRLGGYGGDTSAFISAPLIGAQYLAPNANVARRYFPEEKQPPSPPRDAFLAQKPSHSMRIFVLGESSAAGFPYPHNGTFSRVLRDALSDVLPNDTVEVINMGMAATNSYTIVDLAGDIIDQHPDAVLIYGGHNEYYGALGAGSTESLGSHPGFVRLYLELQRLKTFVLLRNVASSILRTVRGGRSANDIGADATRMESVVADQRIVLNGKTYERGLAQYESNLRAAATKFRHAGIPVFVGSTPSNLRDQAPFGPSAIPPDSDATRMYDSARVVLASDSVKAAGMFARARDLDVVRFRAPGEFQSIVQKVARETNSTYVPVAEGFAAEAAYRIPGSDLFLEHVHPNQRGYVLLAKMYFAAIQQAKFLGRAVDMSRFAGWDAYTSRMGLTDLDNRIAFHTIKTVTTRWPFVPVASQTDYRGTYTPTDLLDSLAFAVSRGGVPWAQAKVMIGNRYIAAGDVDKGLAEFSGLIRDEPEVHVGWEMAARALMAAHQPLRARPYLQHAFSLRPTGFSASSLGLLEMQDKKPDLAVPFFEKALELEPNNASAMYQLSLAYALVRNVAGARALALRLAQVAPQYPGLREWLSALGLQAP
jgi:lysophospholipase L1-like esterase